LYRKKAVNRLVSGPQRSTHNYNYELLEYNNITVTATLQLKAQFNNT